MRMNKKKCFKRNSAAHEAGGPDACASPESAACFYESRFVIPWTRYLRCLWYAGVAPIQPHHPCRVCGSAAEACVPHLLHSSTFSNMYSNDCACFWRLSLTKRCVLPPILVRRLCVCRTAAGVRELSRSARGKQPIGLFAVF